MKLKRKKTNAKAERLIITGLIVSDKFIKSLSAFLSGSNIYLLQTNFSQHVCNWCIEYYNKYKKAPKENIQEIYNKKIKQIEDDTLAELISEFLSSLSGNYEREENYNEDYAIDQGILYLRNRRLDNLVEQIDIEKSKGNIEKAEQLVSEYKQINSEICECIDVLNSEEALDELSDEDGKDRLFKMPKNLGDFFGWFNRGDLISVTAPAKRGKTFWLIEFAIVALMNKLRVVFFSLEMTQKQMMKRIYQNILGEVKNVYDGEDYHVDVPYFEKQGKDEYTISCKKLIKNGLMNNKIKRKAQSLKKFIKGGGMKLFCPTGMTVEDIDSYLDGLVWKDNFIPDVIIVDYADIIKPSSRYDYRHQLDHIWKSLRFLAKEKHCLVITATHSNKKTFEKDIQQSDIVEDIRKMNHISLMFGINQTPEEKEKLYARLKMLANRHDEFNLNTEMVVLQQLKIGRPYIDAKNVKKIKKQ